MMYDDARLERMRLDALLDDIDRLQVDANRPDKLQVMIGRVFAEVAVPTTVPKYFAVHPVIPGGAESEGTAGSNTVLSSAVAYVLVLGPKVPIAGDDLVCYQVGDRWVAQYGGDASVVTMPCSPCPMPQQNLVIRYHYPSTVDGTMQIGPPMTHTWSGIAWTSPGVIEPPHDSVLWTGGGCQFFRQVLQCTTLFGSPRTSTQFRLYSNSSGSDVALCSINTLPASVTPGEFTCDPYMVKIYLGFGAATNQFIVTTS